jgi:hypothetical protein
VDVTAEDFRRHYESLSDEALLEIDTSELVELARTCHEEEVARRGLDAELPEDGDATDAEAPEPGADPASGDELVCVAEFDYVDEAEIAMGLLQAAEIPAALEREPGVERLMVPGKLADQALRMLADSSLSDEELAAQAEAAGHQEEEAGQSEPRP